MTVANTLPPASADSVAFEEFLQQYVLQDTDERPPRPDLSLLPATCTCGVPLTLAHGQLLQGIRTYNRLNSVRSGSHAGRHCSMCCSPERQGRYYNFHFNFTLFGHVLGFTVLRTFCSSCLSAYVSESRYNCQQLSRILRNAISAMVYIDWLNSSDAGPAVLTQPTCEFNVDCPEASITARLSYLGLLLRFSADDPIMATIICGTNVFLSSCSCSLC